MDFFSSPTRGKQLSLFSFSLMFTLWSTGTAKSIYFGSMVKLQLLVQFTGDNLLQPVVSNLVLFLCLFAAFTYNVINYYSKRVFSDQRQQMIFHRSLSDSKSPQISRTLLSILADLHNAAVWMVSTRPFISNSSSPFIYPIVTVRRAPVTIGINVTFMFYRFFQFPSKVVVGIYPSFHSLSILLWSAGTAKSTILKVLFFLLIIIRSGRLDEIKWSVWMSKSQRSLCESFSRTVVKLCIYHLFIWSNWNLLHNSL